MSAGFKTSDADAPTTRGGQTTYMTVRDVQFRTEFAGLELDLDRTGVTMSRRCSTSTNWFRLVCRDPGSPNGNKVPSARSARD
jgi:hypothetical protein